MKNKIANQQGMTFIGLVLVLGFIAILVLFTLRAFPLFYERTQIVAALQSVSNREGSSKFTEREAQKMFLKGIQITNIERFNDHNVKDYVTLEKPKSGSGPKILRVKYDATNKLAGGLELLLHVNESVPLTGPTTGEN